MKYILTMNDGTQEIVEADGFTVRYGFTSFYRHSEPSSTYSHRMLDSARELAEGEQVPPGLEDEHGFPVRSADRLAELEQQVDELRDEQRELLERLRLAGVPR